MTPLAELQHCVNNIAARKSDQIRALLQQGLPSSAIAAQIGVRPEYVRAVRQRTPGYVRRRPPRTRSKPERTQSQAELQKLAQTLYRWRQEGRYDQ